MVGVFVVIWLAAMMSLAAAGALERQLADRFMNYTGDRAQAFEAAEAALANARDDLTTGPRATDIHRSLAWRTQPHGIEAMPDPGRDVVKIWQRIDWRDDTKTVPSGMYVPVNGEPVLRREVTEPTRTMPSVRTPSRQGASGTSRDAASSSDGAGDGANNTSQQAADNEALLRRRGRYLIERVPRPELDGKVTSGALLYRVSAVGYGTMPGTRVYLQAIYEVTPKRPGSGFEGFVARRLSWREVALWHSMRHARGVSVRD